MRIALATNNAHKLTELRRIVAQAGLELEIVSLADLPGYPEPAETEQTFEGNALLKARACLAATGVPALADDSGLAVDVLNGMPGVRSARWAGPEGDDQANNDLLLRQLSDVPEGERTAQFVCAVALVLPDGAEHVRRGVMSGHLVSAPRGENGFGYDPLFVADGYDVTTAELNSADKDAISHRGRALQEMIPVLAVELEHVKETS